MKEYNPARIESKWQKFWDENGLFKTDNTQNKTKFYILTMFPYPSGVLHMGHVINYTIGDAVVRYYKMSGKDILSPIGWDSFGLPAENAAIKKGIPPKVNTKTNIDAMREQMKSAGWGYDWDREIATSNPDYYRWTQWLFLQFYAKKLAVRKQAPVNWCPSCQTVLANEQVINAVCERCNTEVIQKDLRQWFFTMKRYAQRLLDNHKKLDQWPEKVIKMQQEWIGRSEGARIDFNVTETSEKLPIFTTRPDTIFGVSFMAIAPEHPLIEKLLEGTPQEKEVMKVVKKMRSIGTSVKERLGLEKEGIATGFHVTNPVNGEKVPLWVANFALMTYGTGAVMSVPAHDQRDFEFAKKYDLPIKVVIQPENETLDPALMEKAYVDDGSQINSAHFDGMNNRKAIPEIIKWIEQQGFGEKTINYSLRDWLISRQRYWGVPIPIVYCEKCGEVPVPEKDLPIILPDNVDFKPTGESPLAGCEEFMQTTCPQCNAKARRDPDTMDTFVDSSWYMFRYISPRDEKNLFDKKDVEKWCPVDFYVGGIEHATMHLIYTRFFTMVMNDLGLIDFDEPVKRLFCQGMVNKMAHYCDECKWLPEDKVENGKCKNCGTEIVSEVTKMSKTKMNTVSPDKIIEQYGADTMRLYILSDTPPDREQVWNDEGVHGSHRFLKRFWDLVHQLLPSIQKDTDDSADISTEDSCLYEITIHTIKTATSDYENTMQFNTALARVYELINAIKSNKNASPDILRLAIESAIKILYPITPHICEELWQDLGNKDSMLNTSWADKLPDNISSNRKNTLEKKMQNKNITVVIQINGKVRSKISIPSGTDKDSQERMALTDAKIADLIKGKNIVKKIVIPNKLVNIVVK